MQVWIFCKGVANFEHVDSNAAAPVWTARVGVSCYHDLAFQIRPGNLAAEPFRKGGTSDIDFSCNGKYWKVGSRPKTVLQGDTAKDDANGDDDHTDPEEQWAARIGLCGIGHKKAWSTDGVRQCSM